MCSGVVALSLAGVALAQDPVLVPLPPTVPEVEVALTPDTLFRADEEVVVEERAQDLFLMGRSVELRADVLDNGMAMAQQVDVSAPVHGDLFVMAENVTITAPVGGDVYGLASRLQLVDGGSVGGNVLVGAGVVELDGPVGGDVQIGAGRVVLGGPIGGDVELEIGELELGPGATIGGDLVYEAPTEVAGVEGIVNGAVRFTQKVEEIEVEDEPEAPPSLGSRLVSFSLWTSWSYASKLLVGAAFLALGGAGAARLGRSLGEQPGRALALGFVITCALPVASMLALALVIPIPLGILGWLAFLVALYGAQIVAAQALGEWALRRLGGESEDPASPYLALAVGLVPLVLVTAIPWVGTLAWIGATVAGVGAVWIGTRGPAAEVV
ncbi:MAG: hypothetical protein ABMA64_41140, partial [Myxococcota bacterium]